MTSVLPPAILLTAGVLAVPVGRRLTGDFFHPIALIAAVWGVSLGLFLLYVVPFIPPTTDALVYVLEAIGALIIGTILGQRLGVRGGQSNAAMVLRCPRGWVWSMSVFGLVGALWYVGHVVTRFGWAGFRDAVAIRRALAFYDIPSSFLFLEVCCIVAPLLALALHLCGAALRRIDWAGPIACGLATWLTTDRTQFFLVALTGFFLFVMRRGPKLSWGGLFIAGAAAGSLLMVNFAFVDLWTKKSANNPLPLSVAASSNLNRPAQQTAAIYMYGTGSYAALGQAMSRPLPRTHGLLCFYPAARLVQRFGIFEFPLPDPKLPLVNIMRPPAQKVWFNGYTFLYFPLADFGRAGSLGYAAALGLLVGLAYGRLVRRRDAPARLLISAQIATALTLSTFANRFANSVSWYVLVGTVGPFLIMRFSERLPHASTASGALRRESKTT